MIIGWGWAKYCGLSVVSRSIIRLRQIIDLRDPDKSWYFAITKFNNIVLSFSHRVCFLINIFGKLPFPRKSDHKKKKSVVSFTQLDDIAHEQTIICRHLIAGHVVGSQPMRRKKNLRQMIIRFSSHPRAKVRHKGPLSSAIVPVLVSCIVILHAAWLGIA